MNTHLHPILCCDTVLGATQKAYALCMEYEGEVNGRVLFCWRKLFALKRGQNGSAL